MEKTLKLKVIFTTLTDTNKSEVLCKVPDAELIEDLINKKLQNCTLDYAIAYIDSFPTFDQFEVSYVEWVRVSDIQRTLVDDEEYHSNVKIEVIDVIEQDAFDVEFRYDLNMETLVPNYIIINDIDKQFNQYEGVETGQ